ncbi:MAG: hypothetical protein ACM33B_12470 [Pseudomonadota bacterium]
MRGWKREHRKLEAELRANRAAPSHDFVRALSRHVEDRSRNRTLFALSRVSFAASLTVLMVGMLASFGGLGYAASAPTKAVDVVKAAVVTNAKPRVVQRSAGQAQYEPRKVTICHRLPNGRRVTITISESALAAHLRHGDTQGACPAGVGGVAGVGGGGTLGAGGSLGATSSAGSLPFTGLSLGATLLLSSLLLGAGIALRRRATTID